MRCDCCQLSNPEDTCTGAEGEYGIEHKDGVCGAHNDSTNDQNMRYCPHCGPKMDVEIDK